VDPHRRAVLGWARAPPDLAAPNEANAGPGRAEGLCQKEFGTTIWGSRPTPYPLAGVPGRGDGFLTPGGDRGGTAKFPESCPPVPMYDALVGLRPSPVYLLNRAIVVARIKGPRAAIRSLDEAGRDPALWHYHLFDATLGELYRCAGDPARARQYFEAAWRKTTSPFDREIIDRRLA
jgi:hypothetical protein